MNLRCNIVTNRLISICMLPMIGPRMIVVAARRAIPIMRLRTLRGFASACLIVIYVLASALHGFCDLDVTNPASKSEIASLLAGKTGHQEQKGAVSEHHCHGCFSVAVPLPPVPVAKLELAWSPAWPPFKESAGRVPDTESPPPKHLT